MEYLLVLTKILGLLFLFVAIIYFINLHFRTKSKIDQWAKKEDIMILKKKYTPWYRHGYLSGGFHPAHFRVIIKDDKGELIDYSIIGGGLFWLSDKIDIRIVS